MNVFVTGGSGFIGSAVVRALKRAGHDIVCLLRPESQTTRIDDIPVERRIGDVRDVESLRSAIAGCDATVHLAGLSSWEEIDSPNLAAVVEGGTRNILEVVAERRNHRVVIVSSAAAINGSETPQVFDEQSEFTLTSADLSYAHAKRAAERFCRDAFRRGVSVVIVNPAEVYGPGDTALVTAGNLIDFAKSNPVLVCRGGTSIVHVDDVAAGILAALETGRAGERYILGGENLTIRQLAALCLRLLAKKATVLSVPNGFLRTVSRAGIRWRLPLPYNPRVVPYATRYWFVDATKARREFGVTFRNAEQTIGPTLNWLRHEGLIP